MPPLLRIAAIVERFLILFAPEGLGFSPDGSSVVSFLNYSFGVSPWDWGKEAKALLASQDPYSAGAATGDGVGQKI